MRFCDFFISYKIGLKGIKNTIPFIKLPLYRKIAIITIFAISIISGILFMLKCNMAAFVAFAIGIISLIIFIFIDSIKCNLETMLNNHYIPHSQRRMDMLINVLQQYGIDIHNTSKIDQLIGEAHTAQIQCDYFSLLKKPLTTLGAIIVPIVVYAARKIGDNATQGEMITMSALIIAIVLMIFSLIFALNTIVKDIFYRDYNVYNELIYDLRQIKLFYVKESSASAS